MGADHRPAGRRVETRRLNVCFSTSMGERPPSRPRCVVSPRALEGGLARLVPRKTGSGAGFQPGVQDLGGTRGFGPILRLPAVVLSPQRSSLSWLFTGATCAVTNTPSASRPMQNPSREPIWMGTEADRSPRSTIEPIFSDLSRSGNVECMGHARCPRAEKRATTGRRRRVDRSDRSPASAPPHQPRSRPCWP